MANEAASDPCKQCCWLLQRQWILSEFIPPSSTDAIFNIGLPLTSPHCRWNLNTAFVILPFDDPERVVEFETDTGSVYLSRQT